MKQLVSRLVLLLVTLMVAQVQGQSPSQPVLPRLSQEQVPKEQMPPDQEAPPARLSTPEKVQQQIEQRLNAEPALQNSKVSVHVDEDLVILNWHSEQRTTARSCAAYRPVLCRRPKDRRQDPGDAANITTREPVF